MTSHETGLITIRSQIIHLIYMYSKSGADKPKDKFVLKCVNYMSVLFPGVLIRQELWVILSLLTRGHSDGLMIKSGGVWRGEVTAGYDLSLFLFLSSYLSHTHTLSCSPLVAGMREVWFYLTTSINPCFGLSQLKGSRVISPLAHLLTSIRLTASLVSFLSLISKRNDDFRLVQNWS